MLTPEQKKTWRRLDSLTSGLVELLQWNSADGNDVTSEDADSSFLLPRYCGRGSPHHA